MIVSFADSGTRDVWCGARTAAARKVCPEVIWPVARRKLDQLNTASRLGDLSVPPKNRLEKLVGDRRTEYSIRINGQYRICFHWTEDGPADVGIIDYH